MAKPKRKRQPRSQQGRPEVGAESEQRERKRGAGAGLLSTQRSEEHRADFRQSPQAADVDPVEEASEESFPASDAPAWILELQKRKPRKRA